MRILLTNVWLSGRGGTECVVRDLAHGLLARGHAPVVYSPILGEIAEEIRGRGVAVVDDLRLLRESPDIIHGHHFIPTAEAIIRFPEVPVLSVCHAWKYWVEQPPKFPQIRRYAAVSRLIRERLIQESGIDPATVQLLPNAVDLARFRPRPAALPDRPRRFLAFTTTSGHLPLLRALAARLGAEFKALGRGGDRMTEDPERDLHHHDLVFATGRSALEALACGCAVIVCDETGLGGLVTTANFAALRRDNFALRALTRPLADATVLAEIAAYDAGEAARVAAMARRDASLEAQIDRVETIYRDIIRTHGPVSREAWRAALQDFLRLALPRVPADAHWPWPVPPKRIEALDKAWFAGIEARYALDRDADIARRAEVERRLQAEKSLEVAHRQEAEAEAGRERLKWQELERQFQAERLVAAEEVRRLRAAIAGLHASTSWRVTAPLRSLAAALRPG
ncbi:MAG TPA: glycosyltransferase [Roseomonas sp.]